MVRYMSKLAAIARLSQALSSKVLEDAAEDDGISLMDMLALSETVDRLFFDPLEADDLFDT